MLNGQFTPARFGNLPAPYDYPVERFPIEPYPWGGGGGYDPPIHIPGTTTTPALMTACNNACSPDRGVLTGTTCTCEHSSVDPQEACNCLVGTPYIENGICKCRVDGEPVTATTGNGDTANSLSGIIDNILAIVREHPLISAGAVAGGLYLLLGSKK